MFASGVRHEVIKPGDKVILYESAANVKAVTVDPNGTYQNKYGIFKHKDWIGLSYGSTVQGRPTMRNSCWVSLLAPTPELWTKALRHRTQILYIADISVVCAELQLRPGCQVLECGTGSGSLTHSLARAVAPSGHVFTYEFHEGRAQEAEKEFKDNGVAQWITVTHRNIEELGFPEDRHGKCDAVFLDLPGPWKVVGSASKCLKPNGYFCSFSPCIEQVQKTCDALRSSDFADVRTIECLLRQLDVREEQLQDTSMFTNPTKRHKGAAAGAAPTEGATPVPSGTPVQASKAYITTKPYMEAKGHTGYLTFARKLVPL